MEIRQLLRAAGQPLIDSLDRQIQIAAEVRLEIQAVIKKGRNVHLTTAAQLRHGITTTSASLSHPAGCNSRRDD